MARIPTFVARQLRRPSGLLGRFVARQMDRGNAAMNRAVVRWLEIEVDHHVLDLGFGSGVGLAEILPRLPRGRAAGVELSETMLAGARRRFRRDIAAGRLLVERGAADAIPFEDAAFDRICTINTLYFWPDVAAGFAETRRALRPGGVLAIGIRPPSALAALGLDTTKGFTARDPAETARQLEAAGYARVRVEHGDDDELGYAGIIGRRAD